MRIHRVSVLLKIYRYPIYGQVANDNVHLKLSLHGDFHVDQKTTMN